MDLASAIKHFGHHPKRGFRFERSGGGSAKKWWASCQFEVRIELDEKLSPAELAQIEYRQFIRGGVWFRRGTEAWKPDHLPNGNAAFKIPAYGGLAKPVIGIPSGAVAGAGLSFDWKEDGEVEAGGTERYGYRDTANVAAKNEVDHWQSVHSYLARDTPSIGGDWGSQGEAVEVWIELYFQGFVVQVERNAAKKTQPVKVLDKLSWEWSWKEMKMTEWLPQPEAL